MSTHWCKKTGLVEQRSYVTGLVEQDVTLELVLHRVLLSCHLNFEQVCSKTGL